MPIYEYKCKSCGHEFDMMQKMGERSNQKCEECGKESERMISQSSFLLKGSGWYATDYAGKKAHTKSEGAPSCASGGCAGGSCPKA